MSTCGLEVITGRKGEGCFCLFVRDCASRRNYPAGQTDRGPPKTEVTENAQLIKEEACDTMGYYATILRKGKVWCGMSSRRDSEETAAEKQVRGSD